MVSISSKSPKAGIELRNFLLLRQLHNFIPLLLLASVFLSLKLIINFADLSFFHDEIANFHFLSGMFDVPLR